MLQKFRSKLVAVATACMFALVTPFAMAGGGGGAIDVAGVVSAIEGAAGPIASIGAAVLLILVGIKVYKWVRRAM